MYINECAHVPGLSKRCTDADAEQVGYYLSVAFSGGSVPVLHYKSGG